MTTLILLLLPCQYVVENRVPARAPAFAVENRVADSGVVSGPTTYSRTLTNLSPYYDLHQWYDGRQWHSQWRPKPFGGLAATPAEPYCPPGGT